MSNICDLYAGTKSVKRFGPGFVPISHCTVQINGTLQCNESTDASCDHSMDLGVVCRTCDELYTKINDQCRIRSTTQSYISTTEGAMPTYISQSSLQITQTDSHNSTVTPVPNGRLSQIVDDTCITGATTIIMALGAVTGVLVILLLGTVTALLLTCVALGKR